MRERRAPNNGIKPDSASRCHLRPIGIFPEFIDGYGILILPTTGRYFQARYGILVPQNVETLLVAGRCVAGDRVSHAAVRNQMCCAVTGRRRGRCRVSQGRDEHRAGGHRTSSDCAAEARGADLLRSVRSSGGTGDAA